MTNANSISQESIKQLETDNANFTLTSTEETRAGAMACLEALRVIQKIAEGIAEGGEKTDRSQERWWRKNDSAVAVMLHAAGNPGGFMAGFVATLAEYVRNELYGIGYYPDGWEKPEAAMTDEEKRASRAEFDEWVASAMKNDGATEEGKERAYQEAAEQARKSIGGMFTSAEDFSGTCARYVTKIVPSLLAAPDGYSFENKTAEKIDQSIAALSETIRSGDVVFSRTQQMRNIDSIVAQAFEGHRHRFSEAEMEANIQRFMVELLTATSDAAAVVPA